MNEWESQDPIWSTSEVAARCGVHPRTVARWVARGALVAIRIGGGRGPLRMRPCDVRAFFDSQRQGTRA